jgi:hypothetical protein
MQFTQPPQSQGIGGNLTLSGQGVSPTSGAREAIQALLDQALTLWQTNRATGRNMQVSLFLPGSADAYALDGPLYWPGQAPVRLYGEGSGQGGTCLRMGAGLGSTCLYLGMPRATQGGASGHLADATYRPNLAAKMDATCNASARWGLRFNGDMGLWSQGTPASHGSPGTQYAAPDSYAELQQVTMEFYVEGFVSAFVPTVANMIGLVSTGLTSTPSPLAVASNSNGSFTVSYRTSAGRLQNPSGKQSFSFAAPSGPQRLVVMLDFVAGAWTVFRGTATTNVLITSGTLTAGAFLAENEQGVFAVNTTGGANVQGAGDWALYGLAFSRGLRYNATTGNRADAGVISDAYRYFNASAPAAGVDPKGMFYLPFTEDPAGTPRRIALAGGALCGYTPCDAWLIHADTIDATVQAVAPTIEDIQIDANATWGAAVQAGSAQGGRFRRATLNGGVYGWGNFSVGLPGPGHVFGDCRIGASDVGVYVDDGSARLAGLAVKQNGKWAVRGSQSDLRVDGATVEAVGSPAYGFLCSDTGPAGGGHARVDDVPIPILANPYLGNLIEVRKTVGPVNTFMASNVNCMNPITGWMFRASGVGLVDPAGSYPPGYFRATECGGDTGLGLATFDGDGYSGELVDCYANNGPMVANTAILEPRVAIRAINRARMPRRGKAVLGGCEVYDIPSAADGCPRQIHAVTDGRYGSLAPPVWGLADILQQNPALSCGGYALDATSFTVTLNAQAGSAGWFSPQYHRANMLKFFFGGGPALPTSFAFALKTTPAADAQSRQVTGAAPGPLEPPVSAGYARVAIANNATAWPAVSGGTKQNAVAIAWPAATSAYTVQAVAILDQAGNNIAEVALDAPLALTSGQSASIAAAKLLIRHMYIGPPFGNPIDYGWNALINAIFGATALAAPASWGVALCTAWTLTAPPTEVAVAGYARAAVANTPANWVIDKSAAAAADIFNAATISFGAWTAGGTAAAWGLHDGTNFAFAGPLCMPITVAANQTPRLARGALNIGF